jgi:hypothetical protein
MPLAKKQVKTVSGPMFCDLHINLLQGSLHYDTHTLTEIEISQKMRKKPKKFRALPQCVGFFF